jgi:hypothetical protein
MKQVTHYVEVLPVYLPHLLSQLQCHNDGTIIFQEDSAHPHFYTKVFVHLNILFPGKLIRHGSCIPQC